MEGRQAGNKWHLDDPRLEMSWLKGEMWLCISAQATCATPSLLPTLADSSSSSSDINCQRRVSVNYCKMAGSSSWPSGGVSQAANMKAYTC